MAQFATSYIKKDKRQKAVIDPRTDIGQQSNEAIVGGETQAPLCMKLSNKIIMKKRSEKSKPIPLLLYTNSLDDYGERLMLQPWRSSTELVLASTVVHHWSLMKASAKLLPMPSNQIEIKNWDKKG